MAKKYAKEYLKAELMGVCGAREIQDYDVVIVGTGLPLAATHLASLTHAPHAMMLHESGVVDSRPLRAPISVSDPTLNPGAAMIGSLIDVMGMYLQSGKIAVGFLSGSQVDKYGNINTTCVGSDYWNPVARLPGSGGANPIGSLVKKTVIMMQHVKQRFPEKVDFITTPGYINGPRAREKAGLPPGTGPVAVITNKAVLRFDSETKEMCLDTVHPGNTVEEVKENTGWDLKVSPDVRETEPPTEEEIELIRTKVDPKRLIYIYEMKGYT